jgi:hypothetical protein
MILSKRERLVGIVTGVVLAPSSCSSSSSTAADRREAASSDLATANDDMLRALRVTRNSREEGRRGTGISADC